MRIFLLLSLMALANAKAFACAICAPSDAQNNFMARLAAADAVVLAEPALQSDQARPVMAVRGPMPTQTLQVQGWQQGAVQAKAQAGDALLLFFNAGSRTWWAAGYLHPTRVPWLREAMGWLAAAGTPSAGVERALFFARALEDAQPTIAQAAYEEVSSQPYAVLREIAAAVPKGLEAWMQRSELRHRRPLYALLWGFVAGEGSGAALQAMASPLAADAAQRSGQELSGLIAAWLEMRAAGGLGWVEQSYLSDARTTDQDVQAVVLALSTLANDGRRLSTAEVIPVYARYIQRNPQRAGFVASDLAAWGRWEFAEAFASALRSRQPQVFASRYAMVFYLLRNPRPEARALLDGLKAERLI